MLEKIKLYLSKDAISVKRVEVLDGIRVLAIGLISWFHIWQQSWLAPHITIGSRTFSLMPLPRAGYLWVDMFILLSAFQLFLPHARNMISNDNTISTKEFYKRRAKRILPSYVLSVLICLYIALFSQEFTSFGQIIKELLTHFTFTQTFFIDTYIWTKLNVVLWTVAILVQFYIIFPFIAKAFKKFPTLTFLSMCLVGTLFRVLFVNSSSAPSMFLNQLPAFFDVFAIGIVGAYAYVALNKIKYQIWSPVFTLLSIGSLFAIYYAMSDLTAVSGNVNLQHWQGINRSLLAFAFLLFILSTSYAMKWYRKIFSNRIMVFLSSISFNFYIWHQYIAVKLKAWNFPYSQYDYPNMAGDVRWQYLFTFASFAISILFAWLITWLFEGKLMPVLLRNKNIQEAKSNRRRN